MGEGRGRLQRRRGAGGGVGGDVRYGGKIRQPTSIEGSEAHAREKGATIDLLYT